MTGVVDAAGLLLVVVLATTACTSEDSSAAEPDPGRLEGTFRLSGGPTPGVDEPLQGSVRVAGVAEREISVGPDGTFADELTPGSYDFFGQPSEISLGPEQCPVTTLVVVVGTATRVDVGCFVE